MYDENWNPEVSADDTLGIDDHPPLHEDESSELGGFYEDENEESSPFRTAFEETPPADVDGPDAEERLEDMMEKEALNKEGIGLGGDNNRPSL